MTPRTDIERVAADHRATVGRIRAQLAAADAAASARSQALRERALDRVSRLGDNRVVRPAVARKVTEPVVDDPDEQVRDYRPNSWLT